MIPADPLPEGPISPAQPETAPAPSPVYRWYHKTIAVVFITLCVEMGLFLLIFPWSDGWDEFAGFARNFRPYCDNLYVRGAISGIGIVNLYISLSEIFRLRRFAKH